MGELLERANRDRSEYSNHSLNTNQVDFRLNRLSPVAPDFDEPILIGGDIAISSDADRNADPCTTRGCLWLKYTDGKVYIPYYITNHFCERRPFSLLTLQVTWFLEPFSHIQQGLGLFQLDSALTVLVHEQSVVSLRSGGREEWG